MQKIILVTLLLVPAIISFNTAYAEYCIESNGGTWHCFPDNYDSDDIDYSYRGADVTNDYSNNQKDEPNCYGEDYRCLNEDGTSKYTPLPDNNYGWNYDYNNNDYLVNGCYADLPYLWFDGYCYDIPESEACYADLPYLWSDGYCYDIPENDYNNEGYLDNGCHYDHPYLWSDGYCYDITEYNYNNEDIGISNIPHSIERNVSGTTWNVYDSKGNFYSWSFDTVGYEDLIINGNALSETHDKNPLYLVDSNGGEIVTTSLDYFVYGAFKKTVDDIYYNSDSNTDFIWEVWNIASQLTEYNLDRGEYYIGDEGRYALDTLYRGGGDCEDLAILIADMLVSTKHTEDWTIEYVFMDGDNHINPKTVNHVILHVNDGQADYLIEATGEPRWDYYPDGVDGWSFDVLT